MVLVTPDDELEDGRDPYPDARRSFLRRWLLFVGALLPITVLWALTNPLFAAPDETTHMVRAQSYSAGDFRSPFVTDGLPIGAAECLVFQYDVTADCQDLTWDPDGTAYPITTENSPPFFFLVAAVPAVFTSGLVGAYLMRVWLALVCVAIVAWAGALVTRPGDSAWLLVGFFLSITPMSVFIMASVNPSGLSTAFAILLVAGSIAVCTGGRRSPEVVAAVVLGAVGLAVVRREGVISLFAIALAFTPALAHRVPHWRSWFSDRRRVAVVTAGLAVLTLVTVAFAGPTLTRFMRERAERGITPWEAATHLHRYMTQVIGDFGWLETPIGDEGFVVAMVVAGFVVILGLLATDRRAAASTVLALSALLVAPIAFGVIRYPYLQGRYLLPMWVSVMLLAAAATASSSFDRAFPRRAASLLLATWLGVHLIGFLQNLRRYTVGRSGSWGDVLAARWQPPTMTVPAALFLLGACVVLAVVCVRRLRRELEPVAGSPDQA
jgi:hypothetical protein